ncbi:hypothetical protein J2Z70_003603 [Paenibacillus silagei]|uniref:Transposase n=1 Tax=Paenibacillus silagei TaxID=1670801 RepID=A0ABS4NTQ1_9BACL|nr:hypothetical protein [Paenibacillus silagei]
MYILQESLFSFEEFQKIESKERLPIFFSALDFAELTHKGLAQQLFEDLVAQCQEAGIIDGTHATIDSAAIHAYE